MKFELQISDEAEEDIIDAFLWYEKQKSGLGILFEENLDRAFHLILSDPFIFQIRYKKIRIFFTNKFPFGIHFIVTGNTIQVVAVFHC
ncbi:MAG: type II toxin-antitoxin system RelE/ParE family toxin, partial [Bacteroidota bacterium]